MNQNSKSDNQVQGRSVPGYSPFLSRELLSTGWIYLDIIVVLGILVSFTWLASRYNFISDDAFISWRYARNFTEGHGLVFNVGERVEGYSNLLYVLLVAFFNRFGLDPVLAGRGIGLISGLLLIILSYRLAVRLSPGSGRLYAVAVAAFLVCNPYLAIWSLGGLETTLFALLVLVVVIPLVTAELTRGRFLLTSVAAVALVYTRMEGLIIYGFLAAWLLIAERGSISRRIKKLFPGFLVFGCAVGSLFLWRYFYYGDFLPNTFYVKSGMSVNHIGRGLVYVKDFARNPYVLPAMIVAALGIAFRKNREISLIGALFALLVILVIGVGGDGLPAYRFLVPALAPFFILVGLGADALHKRLRSISRLMGSSVPAVLMILIILSARMLKDDQFYFYNFQKNYEVPVWSMVGKWLGENFPPETTIAAVPIGAVSYYSGLRVIDITGLTDKHIAKVKVDNLGAGWAGHEKSDGAYVLKRNPDLLLLGNIFVSNEALQDPSAFPPYMNPNIYSREEDIVTNPLFSRNYSYAAFPMGNGLFLHSWMRKGF